MQFDPILMALWAALATGLIGAALCGWAWQGLTSNRLAPALRPPPTGPMPRGTVTWDGIGAWVVVSVPNGRGRSFSRRYLVAI